MESHEESRIFLLGTLVGNLSAHHLVRRRSFGLLRRESWLDPLVGYLIIKQLCRLEQLLQNPT